jgi:hypothetical protein
MSELEKCTWTQSEDGQWESDCGNEFEPNDDGPYENGFHFCPYCGKPIGEKPFTELYEDEP